MIWPSGSKLLEASKIIGILMLTVLSVPAIAIGARLAFTVISWIATVLLPLASTACHNTAVLPAGYVTGALLVMLTGKISVACAVPVTMLPVLPNSTVISSGIVNTGGVVSTMLTVWLAVPTLPAASSALHTTLCCPGENGPTVFGIATSVPSKSSVATALPKFTVVKIAVASSTISFGGVITGGVIS